MINPTEADIGRKVIYRPYWEPNRPPETGRLTELQVAESGRSVKVRFALYRYADEQIVGCSDLEWAP